MLVVAMMDCDNTIGLVLGKKTNFGRIMVEAKLMDNNNHFSLEDQGQLTLDACLALVCLCLITFFWRDRTKFMANFENLYTPHAFCLLAMLLQLLGILSNLLHNLKYSQDGHGYLFFDVIRTVFEMSSECVMTLLILMLANGWFTRYEKFDWEDASSEVYAPLFIFNLFFHIFIGCFTFIEKDEYHKYHDFHGWVGGLIIICKLLLLIAFLIFFSWNDSD
jgi:hypothetical protein